MGYTNNEGMVRVDYFKPTGKWYETLEIDMSSEYNNDSVHDAVINSILKKYPDFDFSHWKVVCLEPYHKFSHPVMIGMFKGSIDEGKE